MPQISDNKASVLILCLWAMIFFSVLSVMFGATARQQIILADKIEQRQSLSRIGSSGISMVMDIADAFYKRDYTPETSSLNDFWANNPGLFAESEVGDGYFSLEYAYRDNVNSNIVRWYGIIDEERKLNLNFVDKSSLFRLLVMTAGMDQISALELVNAVIDWRDADDILNNDDNNLSENYEYRKNGYGYGPQNTFFTSLEEVLFVKGMTPGIYSKIREYITVFTDGRININTVSSDVLVALGLSESFANRIVLYRSGPDMTEGTADDNVFDSIENVSRVMGDQYELSGTEKDELANLVAGGMLDVRSKTFTAVCTGRLNDNVKISSKTICVFELGSGIKYWGYRLQGI